MHRVVALVRPPQATFELGCAAEVFGNPRRGLPRRYEFTVCTEEPGPVATTAGYDMLVTHGLTALERADTVIVPGWLPTERPPSAEVVAGLRAAHARGARLASICSGVYALAPTGLLDGRRATTHWAGAEALAGRFPQIQVDPGVLYVDHGDVATSAGCGAGIDLCLHLLRTDQGARYAAQVARSMVMPPHREGGQLQYAAPPAPGQLDGSLAPLLDWATERLGERLAMRDLAAHAGLSPRTLARRFTDQLGVSPGQWLLAQRLASARELLETTDLGVDAVARRVGLSSATNLRRRLVRAVGTTPGAYRQAFRARPS
ncbi:helix-turn-helix domain-containing protein [Pseudonocardia eucalypti]|uniref:Helix-turn-helix domain-containing protein n=1 Tax=Pseudonocardia eucalypti TaxID=648755 RepID=A0ABP9QM21_9PSEU|nr:AraC family transcriptional activator FtrA [Pseudonocardia eucalypti]